MSPPHRRRILMTADAVGGVWTYATSLARGLCQRGYEVTLVTLGPQPGSNQFNDIAGVDGLRLETTDLALEWMDPEGRELSRALTQLAAIGRRLHPNVVHLNGFREAMADWDAPVISVAHSCVGSWWHACRGEEPREQRWREYTANVRSGLARAHCWVAPSYAFRDIVQTRYMPPTYGRVIWNGIDAAGAAPSVSSSKQPVILAAGRLWDEAKNVAALSRIARNLPWPVQVAGSAIAHDNVEPTPLAYVEFLGQLSLGVLREVMTRASIFVAPALYEPFGLTALEAARAGCALVLSDRPSFRELWDGAAIFVDPRNDTALQEALLQLINDERKRREFQRRAARRARRYVLATTVDNYVALYDELAVCATPEMPQHNYAGAAA
jgi:glycosyltransferase involved in cell wall biosynthesis